MARGRGNKGAIKPEGAQQKAAFKHFMRLGGEYRMAELRIVAKEAQVNVSTVRSWYGKYEWGIRAVEKKPRAMSKEAFRDVIAQAARQFKDKLDKGKIVIRYVQDLEKLVKIDALLRGEKTGNETTINLVGVLPRPTEAKPETKDPFAKKPLDLVDIKKN